NEYQKFNRFSNTYPEKLEEIQRLNEIAKYSQAELVNSFLISEYIRTTHAQRAREVINQDWKGKIIYRDQDLTLYFAQLCFSHNEDAMTLLQIETDILCDEDTTINLPFLGVILRLADLLGF